MKKLALFAILLLLLGCQSKPTLVVYQCKESIDSNFESVSVETVLEGDETNDVLNKVTIKQVVSFEQGADLQQLKQFTAKLKQDYQNLQGVTYVQNYTDTQFNDELVVDMEQADLKQLMDVNLIARSSEQISQVSLKDSLADFNTTCEKVVEGETK